MIRRKLTAEECNVIKEIRRNNTREKEVVQAFEKQDRLTWEEDRVIYMKEKIYIPNNKKIREEILKRITTQWMWNIQDNTGCLNYSRELTGGQG